MTRPPLWRTLFGWRGYTMPHPRRTWAVLYVVLVVTSSSICGVLGISPIWGLLVGGLAAAGMMLALEVRYRHAHPAA